MSLLYGLAWFILILAIKHQKGSLFFQHSHRGALQETITDPVIVIVGLLLPITLNYKVSVRGYKIISFIRSKKDCLLYMKNLLSLGYMPVLHVTIAIKRIYVLCRLRGWADSLLFMLAVAFSHWVGRKGRGNAGEGKFPLPLASQWQKCRLPRTTVSWLDIFSKSCPSPGMRALA